MSGAHAQIARAACDAATIRIDVAFDAGRRITPIAMKPNRTVLVIEADEAARCCVAHTGSRAGERARHSRLGGLPCARAGDARGYATRRSRAEGHAIARHEALDTARAARELDRHESVAHLAVVHDAVAAALTDTVETDLGAGRRISTRGAVGEMRARIITGVAADIEARVSRHTLVPCRVSESPIGGGRADGRTAREQTASEPQNDW